MTRVATAAPGTGGRQRRGLPTHLFTYALLLSALALVVDLSSSVTSDEGAYALQVRALEAGDWSLPYAHATGDPESDFYPYVNSVVSEQGHFPLPRQQPYIYSLRAGDALAGDVGMHVVPLLGAIGAAAAAWLLASLLAPGSERAAFWVVAVGPVMVNAPILWAHTVSAAAAGFAVLGWLTLRRRTHGIEALAWTLLVGGVAVGVAVRSEGVIVAAALLTVAAADAIAQRRSRLAASYMLVMAGAGGLWIAQRQWTNAIVGRDGASGRWATGAGGSDGLTGRFRGAWQTLGAGGYVDSGALAVIAVGLFVAGLVLARRRLPDAWVFMAAAAAAWLVRVAVAPTDVMTGLLPAWPMAAVAVAGRRWRSRSGSERVLLAALGLFTTGVVATQYSDGGGLNWGGRFMSPILVPLGVLAVVALRDDVLPALTRDGRAGRLPILAFAAVALVPSIVGLWATDRLRRTHDDIVSAVEATGADVVVTTARAVPRVAWRTTPPTAWLLADPSTLTDAVRLAASGDADRIAVLTDLPPAPVPGYRVESRGPDLYVLHRT